MSQEKRDLVLGLTMLCIRELENIEVTEAQAPVLREMLELIASKLNGKITWEVS